MMDAAAILTFDDGGWLHVAAPPNPDHAGELVAIIDVNAVDQDGNPAPLAIWVETASIASVEET